MNGSIDRRVKWIENLTHQPDREDEGNYRDLEILSHVVPSHIYVLTFLDMGQKISVWKKRFDRKETNDCI